VRVILDYTIAFSKQITGNYELNCVLEGDLGQNNIAELCFSGSADLNSGVFLQISTEGYALIYRNQNGLVDTLRNQSRPVSLPWTIKLLKQGSYFRFWVNAYSDWIQGPSGQSDHHYEPWTSQIGVRIGPGLSVKKASVTELPMLSHLKNIRVISHDPKGMSWKDAQVVPGAILKWRDDTYYLYFMGATYGEHESGASHRSIGLAVSSDLRTWEVKPEKLIQPFNNLMEYFPGGSVTMPDGKVALMFTAQDKNEQWQGFFLATSDKPDGEFKIENDQNPGYKFGAPAHEFDLVKLENHRFQYLLFFAGYDKASHGDRGYMLYSNDLKTWTEDKTFPNFFPETKDNWDAIHVRPRSLNKVGDMWYLWYEGVNCSSNYCYDVVGLARSKDLYHWEYHPRNPILSGMGVNEEQPDNTWTGWPRMILKDSLAYIFYAGANPPRRPVDLCMKTMTLAELTNWDKAGKTFDLDITKPAEKL
jgi:predicted GH43/DUF377 family glycosyl hydrolase